MGSSFRSSWTLIWILSFFHDHAFHDPAVIPKEWHLKLCELTEYINLWRVFSRCGLIFTVLKDIPHFLSCQQNKFLSKQVRRLSQWMVVYSLNQYFCWMHCVQYLLMANGISIGKYHHTMKDYLGTLFFFVFEKLLLLFQGGQDHSFQKSKLFSQWPSDSSAQRTGVFVLMNNANNSYLSLCQLCQFFGSSDFQIFTYVLAHSLNFPQAGIANFQLYFIKHIY